MIEPHAEDASRAESYLMKWIIARAFAAAMVGLYGSAASADTPKELKVKSGTSVAVVNS